MKISLGYKVQAANKDINKCNMDLAVFFVIFLSAFLWLNNQRVALFIRDKTKQIKIIL